MIKGKEKQTLSAYLYMAPALLLMLIFIVFSLFSSVEISLTDWSGLKEKNFVGFENYKKLFENDSFWNSMKVQFIWVIMSVVLLALAGLVLSIIVEFFVSKFLTPIFRTVFFMPMMMSLVAVGILWTLIFNPMIGVVNELLRLIGMLGAGQTIDLLGNGKIALYVAFIPAMWQWAGFGMVIFSAAMQGISGDILEAATVDGCSRILQIRYIILPLMKPTIATVCMLNLIGGFKCFDLIYAMTQGGPGEATMATTIYIYKEMFINGNYGYSAAMAMILFIVTVIFGLLFFKITSKMEN